MFDKLHWRQAYDAFETQRRVELEKLETQEGLLVFGLECALQLYPRYIDFQRLNQLSDSGLIREILVKLWTKSWPVHFSESEMSDLKSKISKLTPHVLDTAGDTPIIHADFGQSICVAMIGILDFTGSGSLEEIMSISEEFLNIVNAESEHVLQASWKQEQGGRSLVEEREAFYSAIWNHNLMKQERERQLTKICELRQLENEDVSLLAKI